MSRQIKDDLQKVTKALPAAAAANYSDALDLGEGFKPESVELEVSLEALPDLVDAKTVTLTIKDSADNETFTAIPELATLVVTGAGGVGASAATRTVRLPSSTRQYVRVDAAVLTAGGNNTAKSYTARLLF